MLTRDRYTPIKFLTQKNLKRVLLIDRPPIIVDIRDKEKFDSGHIPNAINIPIFNKPQKKIIDTLCEPSWWGPPSFWTITPYLLAKIKKFLTPQIETYVSQLKNIILHKEDSARIAGRRLSTSEKTIVLCCWLGGPYSRGFATILKEYGINVLVLEGGYHDYQILLYNYLFKTYSFKILGGHIGSGKTAILYELQKAGEQILDLEKCAEHKKNGDYMLSIGSQLSLLNSDRPIWVEEKTKKSWKYQMQNRSGNIPVEVEGSSIRYKHIRENSFWEQIKAAPIYRLELPIELRLKRIIADYSPLIINELKEKAIKLTKHLGHETYALVIKSLESGNFDESTEMLLKYYDSYYNKTTHKRNAGKEIRITLQEDSPEITAKMLIKEVYKDEL